MKFLDEFLLNVRKYNDIYKLQFTDAPAKLDEYSSIND